MTNNDFDSLNLIAENEIQSLQHFVDSIPALTVIFNFIDFKVIVSNQKEIFSKYTYIQDLFKLINIDDLRNITTEQPLLIKNLLLKTANKECLYNANFKFFRKNNFEGLIACFEDLTGSLELLKSVRDEKEYLKNCLNIADVGRWHINPITKELSCDIISQNILGIYSEKIDFNLFSTVIYEEDIISISNLISHALTYPHSRKYEITIRVVNAKNEIIKYVHCIGKSVYNEGRTVASSFSGIVKEISKEISWIKALEESEIRFRTMVEQAPIAILVSRGEDMVSESVNKSMLELMGKTREEVIGKPLIHVIPGIKDHIIETYAQKAYKTGETINLWDQRFYVTRNNQKEKVFCNLTFTPLIENDKITGIIRVALDVTEQVEIKNALQNSELLFRKVTTASPNILWITNDVGEITYTNNIWLEWTGKPVENALGLGWLDLVVDEDREQAKNKFYDDFVNRRYHHNIFRISHINGEIRYVICSGNPQYTDQAGFVGYIGACNDITKQIEFEKKLGHKNNELNQINNELEFLHGMIPSVIWTANANGIWDYVSLKWKEYCGEIKKHSIHEDWLSKIHFQDYEQIVTFYEKSLQEGLPFEIELRLLSCDNEYRWFLLRAYPYKSNENKIIKWYGIILDIEDRKNFETQKDEFIGIASHELKTPVTSLKAYAQVLEAMFRKNGDEKTAEMLSKMDIQINRLSLLISDLLDVTKISSGKLKFNKASYDFNKMVSDVVEELQRTCLKHTLEINLGKVTKVIGDRDRISQVVTNLITNAVKYSPHSNKVLIVTEMLNSGNVKLTVKDYGIGIPADKTTKVFQQFYRVSGSKQHTFPGLGIGLYISSEIIKREGGEIWVDSVLDQGSSFYFTIPLKQN
jgi:PAS domain S-box-containing protein